MRHTAVRRTVLALAAVLVLSAWLFGWIVSPRHVDVPPAPVAAPSTPAVPAQTSETPPKVPSDGAALFRSYCGGCHSSGRLRLNQSRRDLEIFLRTHGTASDAEDAIILDFLASRR